MMRLHLYALGALAGLLAFAGTAMAAWGSPGDDMHCSARINGVDMAEQGQVSIQKGSQVDYAFSADAPVRAYEVQLQYGPYKADPQSGESGSDATSATGSLPLDDYAWLGVGLYEVHGTVELEDGRSCTGTFLVNVEGNPLTTVVGGTAAAVSGASSVGLILLFLKDAGLFGAGA